MANFATYARQRGSSSFDLLHHCGRHLRLYGNVGRSTDDLLPGAAQDNGCRFRIKPEVEFVAGIVHELRIVALRG